MAQTDTINDETQTQRSQYDSFVDEINKISKQITLLNESDGSEDRIFTSQRDL